VVTFWKWFVRNPAFLVAIVALLCGATSIAEWSLALSAAAGGAIVGEIAWHFARVAEYSGDRRAEKRSTQEARRKAEAAKASAEAAAKRLADGRRQGRLSENPPATACYRE
jgi:hypothetical protein